MKKLKNIYAGDYRLWYNFAFLMLKLGKYDDFDQTMHKAVRNSNYSFLKQVYTYNGMKFTDPDTEF